MPTKPRTARGSALPKSFGGTLELQGSLVNTLCIERNVLMNVVSRRDRMANEVFLKTSQGAWARAWAESGSGHINFVFWLRELLNDAYNEKLWIPPIFIKRLRQIERDELIVTLGGEELFMDFYVGFPPDFRACCDSLNWQPEIVPRLGGAGCEYLRGKTSYFCSKADEVVRAVSSIWKQRPQNDPKVLRWVVSQIRKLRVEDITLPTLEDFGGSDL